MEEGEEDDHEGPGPITSRRPRQPGTLMTVRGGKEVARNVRKGCRTLDEEEDEHAQQIGIWSRCKGCLLRQPHILRLNTKRAMYTTAFRSLRNMVIKTN
jgi:hypothetical protein